MSTIYGINFLENNVNNYLDESRKFPREFVTLTLNNKLKKSQTNYPALSIKFKINPQEK